MRTSAIPTKRGSRAGGSAGEAWRRGVCDRAHTNRVVRQANRDRWHRESNHQACQGEHPGAFPSPAYYELQFPDDVAWAKKKCKRALNDLVERIHEWERTLRERNAEPNIAKDDPFWANTANDSIKGRPDGFECDFHLLHWPSARHIRREPGSLGFRFIRPKDVEDRRSKRLQQAFDKKCPKLERCKEDGARTILVLESSDPGLGIFEFMGGLLPSALASRTNAPDEIFLAETYRETWEVRPNQTRQRPLARHGDAGAGRFLLRPRQLIGTGHTRMVGEHTPTDARRPSTGPYVYPLLAGVGPCSLQEGRTERPDARTNRETAVVEQWLPSTPAQRRPVN